MKKVAAMALSMVGSVFTGMAVVSGKIALMIHAAADKISPEEAPQDPQA